MLYIPVIRGKGFPPAFGRIVVGLLWHSTNYILQRGFTPHSGFTDKTFFTVDFVCLVVLAGLVYGADAALRRHAPSAVARWLMGAPSGAREVAPSGQPVRQVA